MTEARLKEIADYHESRQEFDWKDVCGWTYVEHVGTLLAEVRRLREALRQHGAHELYCKGTGPTCVCGFSAALDPSS